MRTPIDRLAVLLMIVGSINWLLVGLFSFDLVANIFGALMFSAAESYTPW